MICEKEAMQRATEEYSYWGQWIVECFTEEELKVELADFETIDQWIEWRKILADIFEERENTAF